MKLLKPSGCLLPGGGGNDKEQTMIVEEQGIGFWTRVQIPSAPLLKNLAAMGKKPAAARLFRVVTNSCRFPVGAGGRLLFDKLVNLTYNILNKRTES